MTKTDGNSPRGQIIVLGMHRSGTSCVGNLLTKLGVYFGDPSVSTGAGEQNRKGFFERRDVRDICDTILQGSGCDWWAVNDFSPERVPTPIRAAANAKFAKLLEEMEQHQPWFMKEPRLCFVWPLLRTQAAGPIFVHVWRDPVEVARSLVTRNGFPIDFWHRPLGGLCALGPFREPRAAIGHCLLQRTAKKSGKRDASSGQTASHARCHRHPDAG
jgi:hypothetical protein